MATVRVCVCGIADGGGQRRVGSDRIGAAWRERGEYIDYEV